MGDKTINKRKTGKKRAYKKAVKSALTKYRPAVPSTLYRKLKFVHSQVVNKSTSPNHIMIYPNSIYDMLGQTGTQQPYLRDQLFALYSAARVVAFSVQAIVTGVLSPDTVKVILGPSRDGVPDVDVDLAGERKGSRIALVNSNYSRKLSYFSWVDGYLGQAKGTTLSDSGHLQTASTNIATDAKCPIQLLFHDLMGNLPSGNPICHVSLKITAYTRFERPLDQLSSS